MKTFSIFNSQFSILLVVALVLFAGCSKDDPAPTLAVDHTTIDAAGTAGSYPIAVTSNTAWTAAVNTAATWCTVSPASVTGNGTVTVSVSENPTVAFRAATVTITAGSLNQTLVVTQVGALTTHCAKCCWDDAAATWVDCYVTTNAYPFDDNTTNTTMAWSGNGETYYDGARSDRDGRANTNAISSTGLSAVQLCKDLGAGWYLPAYEELVNMSDGYTNEPLNGLSGAKLLQPSGWYWSSSELYDNEGRCSAPHETTSNAAVPVHSESSFLPQAKVYYNKVRCAWRP
jgi:hypothetical protein